MNTHPTNAYPSAERLRQRGSATIIFITLVSIMLVLVAANGRTLLLLKRDVQSIEQRQIQRLQRAPAPDLPNLEPSRATP
jgi:hypothetical protein